MLLAILMILLGLLGFYGNQPEWLSIAFIILGSLKTLHSIIGVLLKIVKQLLEKKEKENE